MVVPGVQVDEISYLDPLKMRSSAEFPSVERIRT